MEEKMKWVIVYREGWRNGKKALMEGEKQEGEEGEGVDIKCCMDTGQQERGWIS